MRHHVTDVDPGLLLLEPLFCTHREIPGLDSMGTTANHNFVIFPPKMCNSYMMYPMEIIVSSLFYMCM